MATMSLIATEQISQFKLERIVEEATWKDLLIDLVRRNKLDPWNINLIEIVSKYIEAVRVMEILDLRMPANIMLAASILLRMKSQMIGFSEEQAETVVEEVMERPNVLTEPISFKLRMPPRRKITLAELISALDEAMRIKETRASFINVKEVEIPISISTHDIEEDMARVYSAIKEKSDKLGMVTFTALRDCMPDADMLTTIFISLLFLAQEGKIKLIQERFFGEIIISMAK